MKQPVLGGVGDVGDGGFEDDAGPVWMVKNALFAFFVDLAVARCGSAEARHALRMAVVVHGLVIPNEGGALRADLVGALRSAAGAIAHGEVGLPAEVGRGAPEAGVRAHFAELVRMLDGRPAS